MAWLETVLAALAGTGLTGPERLDAVVLLNGHALHFGIDRILDGLAALIAARPA
jgi:hypothetical protein